MIYIGRRHCVNGALIKINDVARVETLPERVGQALSFLSMAVEKNCSGDRWKKRSIHTLFCFTDVIQRSLENTINLAVTYPIFGTSFWQTTETLVKAVKNKLFRLLQRVNEIILPSKFCQIRKIVAHSPETNKHALISHVQEEKQAFLKESMEIVY